MYSSRLTEILLGSLLDSPAVVELETRAGEKGIVIVKQHFTFSAFEITKAYREGYTCALTAIRLGVAMSNRKLAVAHQFVLSKITSEFTEQIELEYLQPFAKQQSLSGDELAAFSMQVVDSIKQLAKKTVHLFEVKALTEEQLAALISYRETLAITDIVLEKIQGIAPVDNLVAAFLRYDELLGNAILFFFRELLRQDDRQRLQKTLLYLQQEGLCIEMQALKTKLNATEANIVQVLKDNSPNLAKLALQRDYWREIQTNWQTQHEQLLRFERRFEHRSAELLAWAKKISTTLDKIKTKDKRFRMAQPAKERANHRAEQKRQTDINRQAKESDNNAQQQTGSPLKPTLIGLALLVFGFILPDVVLFSLYNNFNVENNEIINVAVIVSGLLYLSLAGQYLWRHREKLPHLAMTFGLIGVGCGIWGIPAGIFDSLDISFLGSYYLDEYRDWQSGKIVGLLISIVLVGQYLWRHRQTLPPIAMTFGLIGVGWGIWPIPWLIFGNLDISFLGKDNDWESGIIVGLLLSILLVGQYLWRHRQTRPHLVMTFGLIGGVIPAPIFSVLDLSFLGEYGTLDSGVVVGLSLSILLVGQYLWRRRQTMPISAMIAGLISIGIEAFFILALWTRILSF